MGIVSEHKETIDGIVYVTQTFPATEGLELGRRLARLIDQNSVGQALLAVDSDDVGKVLGDADFLLHLIIGAARNSEPGEWSQLARDLVRYVKADKCRRGGVGSDERPGSVFENFDAHFAGRYRHMLDVCVWAARLGFAGP